MRNARTVERGADVDPHPAVSGLLANLHASNRLEIEDQAIVNRGRANGAKGRDAGVDIVGPEAEQVCVSRRPMRVAVPQGEQQRAFEQVVRRMFGDRQAVQQTLQSVARQDEVEVFFRGVRQLLQAPPNGCRNVAAHATMLSR